MTALRSLSVTIPLKGCELRRRWPSSDSSSSMVRISLHGRSRIASHSWWARVRAPPACCRQRSRFSRAMSRRAGSASSRWTAIRAVSRLSCRGGGDRARSGLCLCRAPVPSPVNRVEAGAPCGALRPGAKGAPVCASLPVSAGRARAGELFAPFSDRSQGAAGPTSRMRAEGALSSGRRGRGGSERRSRASGCLISAVGLARATSTR